MKYSINSAGRIVAERDIYSLGGIIPKGRVGAKIANESQLSQNGECWVSAGDISGRPDVRIKDNAYIGDFFAGTDPVHTDIITEFSGNTLIPGYFSVRCFAADTKNNTFIKDSFIGVSADVLCGPASMAAAVPFEQGRYDQGAPKGTLFTSGSMKISADGFVRNTDKIRLGKDTYVYVPAGLNARIYWAYFDTSNQLAYAGESEAIPSGLYKLGHPVYNMCMIAFAKNPTLTPTELAESGAKILGYISSSSLIDLRPESASGSYVMDKSSFIMNTDNFGLVTSQLRYLAGSMYDTNMYTPGGSTDYKIYGTFRNVQRLEYTKELPNSHRTEATRDTYISAYDCPLLRVDNDTFDTLLAGKGDLVLRNCIVPKAMFAPDPVNGNTYDGIDFSYANEDIGFPMTGYAVFHSSNKQGLYRVKAGVDITQGLVSHKGNLEASARLYPNLDSIPLDGSIMEQGAYGGGPQVPYEEAKSANNSRIRTGKPVKTLGLSFPSLPAGYSVKAFYYLDENFIIRSSVVGPASVDASRPYVAMLFGKDDDSAINVTDFIALNRTLRVTDHTKAPEITGSSYVGAGVIVRGDVKLTGDPYVNRVLDVNMWERGGNNPEVGKRWDETFNIPGQFNRFRLKELIPVEPGGAVSRAVGGNIYIWYFDENGTYKGANSGWVTSVVIPNNVYYIGAVIGITGDGLLTEGDIAAAGIKYVRAFKKRRYITNELDRTSPEDILIGPDYWEQGTAGGGQADAGKTYEELKAASGTTVRLKRPINVSPSSSISSASGFSRYTRVLDAVTKFRLGESLASAKMALLAAIIQKDPSAAITPAEVTTARLVIEFTPSPRIIVPYGSNTLTVNGMRIRMYDNAVLSRNLNQQGEIVLSGDAVMGYDFNSGECLCSNGHSDAIIKLP